MSADILTHQSITITRTSRKKINMKKKCPVGIENDTDCIIIPFEQGEKCVAHYMWIEIN